MVDKQQRSPTAGIPYTTPASYTPNVYAQRNTNEYSDNPIIPQTKVEGYIDIYDTFYNKNKNHKEALDKTANATGIKTEDLEYMLGNRKLKAKPLSDYLKDIESGKSDK